jgi:hypothetical protein
MTQRAAFPRFDCSWNRAISERGSTPMRPNSRQTSKSGSRERECTPACGRRRVAILTWLSFCCIQAFALNRYSRPRTRQHREAAAVVAKGLAAAPSAGQEGALAGQKANRNLSQTTRFVVCKPHIVTGAACEQCRSRESVPVAYAVQTTVHSVVRSAREVLAQSPTL